VRAIDDLLVNGVKFSSDPSVSALPSVLADRPERAPGPPGTCAGAGSEAAHEAPVSSGPVAVQSVAWENASHGLKLFVVGESSGNPDDWHWLGIRAFVFAHDSVEAASMVEIHNDRVAEVTPSEPMVLCTYADHGNDD
jgi:hypothetical protein